MDTSGVVLDFLSRIPSAVVSVKSERLWRLNCARAQASRVSVAPSVEREGDARYMKQCVELARRALGKTSPNPMVGCVLVNQGQVVGSGHHPRAGEPHAEVFALREAGKKAEGATAYVSLEPCDHTGKTPPCSLALIQARVKRVVVGTLDPNPRVAGRGVERLRKAGIQVEVGVEDELCRATNEAFFHHIVTRKPFACLRYSMSLDGCLLAATGPSKPVAGSFYSLQLQEYDAVVVAEACLQDNPVILCSEEGAKQPLRVVVVRCLDALDANAHIFDTSVAPTLVIMDAKSLVKDVESSGKLGGESMETLLRRKNVEVVAVSELSLDTVLDLCYQRGACSVLLDSRDPQNLLAKESLQNSIPQKLSVVVEPVLVGGPGSGPLGLAGKLHRLSTNKFAEESVIVQGYFQED